jgi:hypothetical protein
MYLAEALLQPACFALSAIAVDPSLVLVAAALVCAEMILVAALGRRLRPGGIPVAGLVAVPLKDALVGLAWLHGLVSNRVEWRGHLLQVLPGTRLARPQREALEQHGVA